MYTQVTSCPALMATKGYAAIEVERAYTRARELCQQLANTPQLFPVLWGLWVFYFVRGALSTAHELGERLLELAQGAQDPALLLEATLALGTTLLRHGEMASARSYLEQGFALYSPQQHRSHAFRYGQDPGVVYLSEGAVALWFLGYPDQALKQVHEALVLAQEQAHPFNIGFALSYITWLHQLRREGERLYEAELYRLKGELLLQQANPLPQEAEICFHRAREIALRQQAKSLELRAAVSLSRLWQRQGKRDEARQLLAMVYDWFTEGFDTADLQTAKALLQELS